MFTKNKTSFFLNLMMAFLIFSFSACEKVEEQIVNQGELNQEFDYNKVGELHNTIFEVYYKNLTAHMEDVGEVNFIKIPNSIRIGLFKEASFSVIYREYSNVDSTDFRTAIESLYNNLNQNRVDVNTHPIDLQHYSNKLFLSKDTREINNLLETVRSSDLSSEEINVFEGTASIYKNSLSYWTQSLTSWRAINTINDNKNVYYVAQVNDLDHIAQADAAGFMEGWNDGWGPFKPHVAAVTAAYRSAQAAELISAN